jgi:hypothetical protein
MLLDEFANIVLTINCVAMNLFGPFVILLRVTVTKTRVSICDWICYLHVVTTFNYYTIAALHNLKSRHINLLNLSALVLASFKHGNYNSLTSSQFKY